MANKIAAVLKHPPLGETLRENGRAEVERFRWENSAAKVNRIYKQLLACA
jgi:glycosyltransferase involved in cell wall biosynthesis